MLLENSKILKDTHPGIPGNYHLDLISQRFKKEDVQSIAFYIILII